MKKINLNNVFASIKGIKEIEQDFMSAGATLHFDDGTKVEISDSDVAVAENDWDLSRLIQERREGKR